MVMTTTSDDYVEFQIAGTQAKGQFRCAECAYGITIHTELPICPMCSGTVWEPCAWSPFGNARDLSIVLVRSRTSSEPDAMPSAQTRR
jgi:hypothetical protein